MTAPARDTKADDLILQRLRRGLHIVAGTMPHLSGLAAALRMDLDDRVPTMGVFASGRLIANRAFTSRLKDNELCFVLAHELLHLALRTHDRARGSKSLEFNYAHDYIINDILRVEMGFPTIPAGGLDMPGARNRSAEDIVLEMRRNADLMQSRSRVFEGQTATVREVLAHARHGKNTESDDAAGDVMGDERERKMFPDSIDTQDEDKARIADIAARGRAIDSALRAIRERGSKAGAESRIMAAQRHNTRPAWQAALQRWIESSSMGTRSFARPSRRAASCSDAILPGRLRMSCMVNVILDTSGSMTGLIAPALGAIADFCDLAGVDQVRVLQCDAAVTSDRTFAPAELAQVEVQGFGGSDLSPAMLMLADDPAIQAAIVITDGDIALPQEPMPYRVVWVVPVAALGRFSPPYGVLIAMEGVRS